MNEFDYSPIKENFLEQCYKINEENVPEVGSRSLDDFNELVDKSDFSLCVAKDNLPLGYIICFQNNKNTNQYKQLNHVCIEGGDNKYTSIAAASILAKVERDTYVKKMCEDYPDLKEKYGIDRNKGYGTKQHLDGIREHGISPWHRKTYGLCKNYTVLSGSNLDP